MANRHVALVLAMWLTWGAILAPSANALPNHVVAGGLFGPGGSTAPGPTNPANAAEFAMYSTDQPSYTLLVGVDSFTAADGTNPALWAEDVGSSWNWIDGDTVVSVGETVRGVGGWTGVNYTSSIDGILRTGVTVQDFGNGTLEAIPTLGLAAGADFVDVTWPALADANGNVVSYELYHATSPAGPFVSIARVNQGGSPAHTHAGLATGDHYYNLAVNYRRDTAGGVYTTTGRSETQWTSIADAPPEILSTDPSNVQGNVPPTASIIVTFSEAMDALTVAWTIGPSIVLAPTWSAPDSLTLSHVTPFTDCTTYIVEITAGRDLAGNDLVTGPVLNPWTFTVSCPAPYLLSTSPVDGATQVRNDAQVVLTFSESMNPTSVVVTVLPSATSTRVWNSPANTTLTLTVSFAEGTSYTVTVAGQDLDGNALVSGPVPNPFDFTTNDRPTVTLDPSSTLVGVCRTGGFGLDIPWAMTDLETSAGNLVVWLNATGAYSGVIAAALTGLTAPFTFSWSTPNTVNGNVRILLVVADGAGEKGQDLSGDVEIDSTAPTVTGATPSEAATGVPTNTPVEVTFSEAMDRTATEGAILISPSASASFAWSAGDTVVTITVGFQPNTAYTVRVRTTAHDACGPGLALGTEFVRTFTTAAGPKLPNPPSGLGVTSATSSAISLSWVRPSTYSDGSSFAAGDVQEYRIFRAASETGSRVRIGISATTTHVDTNVTAGSVYYYWVTVVDQQDRESDYSDSAFARAESPPGEGINPLVFLIPIIAILLILGIYLMRRKKPAAAPPQPAAPAEQAKGESIPEPSPEEPTDAGGGKDFVSCPNCGTMVKPTDAECFVCGTKL